MNYGVQSKVCFCITTRENKKKIKMKGGKRMMKIENATHDFIHDSSIKGECNEGSFEIQMFKPFVLPFSFTHLHFFTFVFYLLFI